jgi:hypothetical protein
MFNQLRNSYAMNYISVVDQSLVRLSLTIKKVGKSDIKSVTYIF